MRSIFLAASFLIATVVAVFGGVMVYRAGGSALSEGFSVFERNGSDRLGRVAGDFSFHEDPVLSAESATLTEFLPIRKDDFGNFAVPTAHAAIILDAATEVPLFEQNADERRSIASITKLFTAMIVVEHVSDLDEPATVDEEAVYIEGTKVGCPRSGYCIGERLHVGEQVSVRNLLKAALMNSANDSAIVLAKHVAGSQEGFATLMNDRAKELGLTNSHFCTPSGLELDEREEECYSSARDIAKVAAYALRYDVLWEIMRTEKTDIVSVDGRYSHEIFNTNELLGQYDNLVGTKTGFTPRAGRSLLAVAADPITGKHRIIAVVLDDLYRWQSVKSMFSWGFSSFRWQ